MVFSSGLGNQIFIYALYLYIKENFKNVNLKPSLFPYKYLNPHQGFELIKLFDDESIENAVRSLGKPCDLGYEPFLHKVIRIFKDKLNRVEYITDNEISELQDVSNAISKHRRFQFVGFFQIPDFLTQVKQTLFNNLRKIELVGNNKSLLTRNLDKETVSIHVRRGDYVGNPYFDVIDYASYYNRAIQYIKRFGNNFQFILFSDDIEWAKKNLPLDKNTEICDWNRGEDSWLDLIMMSKCRHNIIANSSFSYWGAFFNPNPNKMIIAPRIWANNVDSSRICPVDWILL